MADRAGSARAVAQAVAFVYEKRLRKRLPHRIVDMATPTT
jgi:hypothetical protein